MYDGFTENKAEVLTLDYRILYPMIRLVHFALWPLSPSGHVARISCQQQEQILNTPSQIVRLLVPLYVNNTRMRFSNEFQERRGIDEGGFRDRLQIIQRMLRASELRSSLSNHASDRLSRHLRRVLEES